MIKRPWIYLSIALVIVLGVYWFSLFHQLRSEIYIYFLNTQGDNSIWSLIVNWYNYEIKNTYAVGDTLMFRPLLFTLLGIQKGLFGYNTLWWHVSALIMHLVACGCLFRLLWRIKPSILAPLATLFFGISYISINAILYVMIAPYSLFIALVLTALYYLYDNNKRGVIVASICMLFASFIYEMGIVFAFLMLLYLIWHNWRKNPKPIYTPMALSCMAYSIIYLVQKALSPNVTASDIGITTILAGIPQIINLTGFWFSEILLPANFTLIPVPNLFMQSAGIASVSWSWLMIPNVLGIALLAYSLVAKRKGISQNPLQYRYLLLAMIIAYMLVLLLFRVGGRGIGYLLDTNIGTNMLIAFGVVLMYCIMTSKLLKLKETYIAGLALLIFACFSGVKTFTLNYQLYKLEEPVRIYLDYAKDGVRAVSGYAADYTTIHLPSGTYTIPDIIYGE